MKAFTKLFFLVIQILGAIGYEVCIIWAFVEFLLYLFKDHPFNWYSVYGLIGAVIVTIIGFFGLIVADE